jgi:hypothetical protein
MDQDRDFAQLREDIYPSTLSLIITISGTILLWKHQEWLKPTMDGVAKLAPSALNVSAIAVGFLATAQAILLSLTKSRALKVLREEGHYLRLTRFFSRALSAGFLSALSSALLTAMRLQLGGTWRYICVVIWVFSGMTALLCYYRASTMLDLVLKGNALEKIGSDSITKIETDHRQNDIELLEE